MSHWQPFLLFQLRNIKRNYVQGNLCVPSFMRLPPRLPFLTVSLRQARFMKKLRGWEDKKTYWMLLFEIKKRDLTDVNKRTLFEQNCLINSKRILNVYILLSVAFLFQIFFHPQYTIERIKYLIIASGCRQHIASYFWISM